MVARILSIAVFIVLSSVNAQAQYFEERAQARKYEDCIALVSKNKSDALKYAHDWYAIGGGVPSLHCEGLALYEMERFNDAAGVFENAASQLRQGFGLGIITEKNKDMLAVQLNYLAGVSWHSEGELDRSYNALSAAVADIKDNNAYAYDIYIERGLVQFTLEDYDSASADFTSALDINSEKIDAFLYRARSFRRLDEHLKARLDLNAALAISPNQPELLFESGVNYRMQRNDEKALVEWEKLIKKYPDTHWQKLAQDNINLIGQ